MPTPPWRLAAAIAATMAVAIAATLTGPADAHDVDPFHAMGEAVQRTATTPLAYGVRVYPDPETQIAPTPTTVPETTTSGPAPAPAPALPGPAPAPAPVVTAPKLVPAPVPAPVPDRTPPSGGGNWDRLAQCESGGNWSINTGNNYSGGLQWLTSTWHDNGGTGEPWQASRAQQIVVAERLLAASGGRYTPWPGCRAMLGLP